MSKPSARELLDIAAQFGDACPTELAVRVERVLDYCDQGFHECIAEHLKEVKSILNGEDVL